MTQLTQRAVERQEGLLAAGRQLKSTRPKRLTASQQANWKLVEYSVGACKLNATLSAAERAGPAARLRLARLLIAECRFDDAVELLVALADETVREKSPSDVSLRALALLVRHRVERAQLARHVTVLPLRFDLDDYLHDLSKGPKFGKLIHGLRQTVLRSATTDRPAEPVEVVVEERVEQIPVEEELIDALSFDSRDRVDVRPASVTPLMKTSPHGLVQDVGHPYRAATGHELVLYREVPSRSTDRARSAWRS